MKENLRITREELAAIIGIRVKTVARSIAYATLAKYKLDYEKNNQIMNTLVQTKNFQTVCSDESAKRNTKLFTIIQTAKANGLNPEKYLEYVLNSLFEKHEPSHLLPQDDLIPEYIKEPF